MKVVRNYCFRMKKFYKWAFNEQKAHFYVNCIDNCWKSSFDFFSKNLMN